VVLLPGMIFGIAGLVPGSLAALHAGFFAYTLMQGSVASRNFWQTVRATESLRRSADLAHLAAVAADATTLQLRAEISHGAKMEVELRQAQKLEAIGRLAAGIAHEINTPVQFVSDSCRFFGEGVAELTGGLDDYRRIVTELAGGQLAAADALAAADRVDDDRDLSYLRGNLPDAAVRALEGLDRVAKIVAATKEFAYPHVREKSLTDINKAIVSTLIISNNETKYVAEVETELGELPSILCHRGELNQVILNIIVNAAHAIRNVVTDTGKKGVIRVKTWSDPGWIRIAISDTGTGIPAEILDKIFEPFFTTKPVGTGTGQGLAIARSVIVDKHDGTIEVSSELGVGSTFTISLPAA
jgi:signal transduction histidine kinase